MCNCSRENAPMLILHLFMTSVAHMDSPKIVDTGFSQMLKLVVDHDLDADLDVHLVGGVVDVSLSPNKRLEKFHVKTLCVLRHNTTYDSQENAYPIFNGFLVETSSGSVFPASFDRTSRCPDEIVRRLRVSASYEDPQLARTNRQVKIVKSLRSLSDSDILTTCSTSPLAEGPDFVENEKRSLGGAFGKHITIENVPDVLCLFLEGVYYL